MKLALIVAAPLLLGACLTPKSPAQQAQDFGAAFACTQANWGKPIGQLAGACFNADLTAAEDAVADVEAIVEGTAVLAQQDVSKIQATFPYSSDARIVTAVASKRDAFLAAHKGGAQ